MWVLYGKSACSKLRYIALRTEENLKAICRLKKEKEKEKEKDALSCKGYFIATL